MNLGSVSDIVQEAKRRAQAKEWDKISERKTGSIPFKDSQSAGTSVIKPKRRFEAPWHTDPNEGIGSDQVGIRKRFLNRSTVDNENLNGTSGKQVDFPQYSGEEMRVSSRGLFSIVYTLLSSSIQLVEMKIRLCLLDRNVCAWTSVRTTVSKSN